MSTKKNRNASPAAAPAKSGPQQDWEIKNRGDACRVCGRVFKDGEAFWSRLVVTPEGYQREDFAPEHWDDSLQKDAVSFWKSIFHAPPPPGEEPLKKESAEAALRKLMADDDPSNANAIFILAVMLERKKTLVEKDVQLRDDQTKLRVYEHKLTGEAFLITDPQLKLSELAMVQEEVAERLGWKPVSAAAPAPARPATPGGS